MITKTYEERKSEMINYLELNLRRNLTTIEEIAVEKLVDEGEQVWGTVLELFKDLSK